MSGQFWLALIVWFACGWLAVADDEIERLQQRVVWLTDSLASARAEIDWLRALLGRNGSEDPSKVGGGILTMDSSVRNFEFRILEVNEELGMVVVNAGRKMGLRSGMQLTVMRGGRAIASLRIIDVRSVIAGAMIERAGRDYPVVEDRVVMATVSKK